MINKFFIIYVVGFFFLMTYFYFFVLNLEKILIVILPIFIYMMYFVREEVLHIQKKKENLFKVVDAEDIRINFW